MHVLCAAHCWVVWHFYSTVTYRQGTVIWEFAPKRYLEISWLILRYLRYLFIENISRISFLDIKRYLFGYERISFWIWKDIFLDMKGYPWHIHLYPAFIHCSLSFHIQSYPIISTDIHRYPYDIQQFILSYPWTYPLISMDLSYAISFDIHTDIQKLIHAYPSTYPFDIQ